MRSSNLTVGSHDPPRPGEHQGHGVVRDFLDAVVGNIGHQHTVAGRSVHGDVVQTDTHPGDDAQRG